MNMTAFVQGNLALFLGAAAFVGVIVAARLSREANHRRDLFVGARWLGIYLVLRLNGFWLEGLVPDDWHPWLRVTWILAFAFGMTRVGAAAVLWLRRRFTRVVAAKIHRDVLDFVLYVVVAIPILKTQLKIDITTLLGTSAVLSLVLGFALQDTLGNLFSGLSLQLETPFRVGDFIRVGEKEGRVVQIAWRSTRIETVRREEITIPNSLIAKEKVTNFSNAGGAVALELEFGASYAAAPNFVKAEAAETLRESPLVLKEPAPWVRVSEFGDSAVTYKARFFVSDYASQPHVKDEILSRLWYRFGRDGIEIPFPQRVVHLRHEEKPRREIDIELVAKLPLFAPFPIEEARGLSQEAVERRFGAGEEVITEGRPGTTFYVVVSGKLSVRSGTPLVEIATLQRGDAFGEMSLLTGEPRSATVVALEDCTLLEMGRDVFARHLQAHPERLAQLAALIEERKASRAALASSTTAEKAPPPGKALARLREIFGLQ
ncbi:MAG: cyclic nucleotide-binding domain-containing protein [Myxococcota bacterium]